MLKTAREKGKGTESDRSEITAAAIFDAWLTKFGAAVESRDPDRFVSLFHPRGTWRDILAFSWEHRAFSGAAAIRLAFAATCSAAAAGEFRAARGRTAPLFVERAGRRVVEGYFEFQTAIGTGVGCVRILHDDPTLDAPSAWLAMTSLYSLRGFEDKTGANRPTGEKFSRITEPLNWQQLRDRERSFPDKGPEVLIVGAGHSGLMLAARLRQMDVPVLIIEKEDRVGDGWRNRYNSLTLHNPIEANEFPYLPFPATFPVWLPKDLLADWLECYSKLMELNVWTGTRIAHTHFDETSEEWVVALAMGNNTERTIRCKHLVIAVGVSGGVPRRPKIKGLSDFRGTVIHSGEFKSGAGWAGKRALVIGTGNSGHDIAQDLYVNGASAVTIMQRGPTCVISLDPGAMANYSVYFEGRPIEDADLMNVAVPYAQRIEGAKRLTALTNEMDREFLSKLQAAGFKTYQGNDDTGFTLLYARGNGGYYINVGCSDLIIQGKLGVLQAEEVETFTAEGLRRTDGTIVGYDLIVLATGFDGMQANIRHMLGDDFADRVGPVWGLDEDHVMRNMWRRTALENFWIMGGSITEARPFSRFLALEIKASLLGLLPAKDALPLKRATNRRNQWRG
jgi:cation diffusion facilitator CzcD-associated flavoprotein CzcO